MFGRVSTELVAKFLTTKITQGQFIYKLKKENRQKWDDKGTDFNFVDEGYVTKLPHDVRMNKRPLTAMPGEQFGDFTQTLFHFGESSDPMSSLLHILNLPKQNVLMLDFRGEGVNMHKDFNDFHIVGSVSFPHGWLNRYNHF